VAATSTSRRLSSAPWSGPPGRQRRRLQQHCRWRHDPYQRGSSPTRSTGATARRSHQLARLSSPLPSSGPRVVADRQKPKRHAGVGSCTAQCKFVCLAVTNRPVSLAESTIGMWRAVRRRTWEAATTTSPYWLTNARGQSNSSTVAHPQGVMPSRARSKTPFGSSPSQFRRRWSAQLNRSAPR
jgi:hypothetical protein